MRRRVPTPVYLASAALLALGLAACTAGPPKDSAPASTSGTSGPAGASSPGDSTSEPGATATDGWTVAFCTHVQDALRATAALSGEIPPTPALTDSTLTAWQGRLRDQAAAVAGAVRALSDDIATSPTAPAPPATIAARTRAVVAAYAGTDPWLAPLTGARDVGATRHPMVSAGTVAAEVHSAAVQLAEVAAAELHCR